MLSLRNKIPSVKVLTLSDIPALRRADHFQTPSAVCWRSAGSKNVAVIFLWIPIEFLRCFDWHQILFSERNTRSTKIGGKTDGDIVRSLFFAPHMSSRTQIDACRGCSTALWHSFGSKLAWVCVGAVGTSLSRSWSNNASAALAFRISGSEVVPS